MIARLEFYSYNANMKYLSRRISSLLPVLAEGYQAIFIAGPRQSGKTTLARATFPELPFVNLESPLERAALADDPLGFLAQFPSGAILDEIQNVPDALSYLQVIIDDRPGKSLWVLTGSRQLELQPSVAQSLAGRAAMVELLPFSHDEVRSSPRRPSTLEEAVLRGGYPPLFDQDRELEPGRWLEDYLTALVNRDIFAILPLRNRSAFDRFVRLCASRTGQIFEAASLARELGVDNKTVGIWVSVLEQCFIVRRLRPHHQNYGKRLIKRPKLFFLDSGLACRLLQIRDANQLRLHPLWGALVETWSFTEVLKARLHRGLRPDCWFWRTSDGKEIDLLIEVGRDLYPIEIKSSATPDPRLAQGIRTFRSLVDERGDGRARVAPGFVVYGGDEQRPCRDDRFVPWHGIGAALEHIP